jgi:hypothetical protein
MRIHSDTLNVLNLLHAAQRTNERFTEHGTFNLIWPTEHGSRKRDHAFEIALEGDGTKSRRRRNPGTSWQNRTEEPGYAATWDQWGWFLAELFRLDPNMTSTYYDSAEDFHNKTHGAFEIEEAN